MFPVADDFAAIARRLKEIQAEAAQEHAQSENPFLTDAKPQPERRDIYEDIAVCA